MIERHPRLGFAILGSVLLAFAALAVIFVHGAAGTGPAVPVEVAPSTAGLPRVAVVSRSEERTAPRVPGGVDPAWAARMGARVGIPVPAVRAYADAELLLGKEQPGCHVSWNTLAGIGWVESQHGTIDGRTLLDDGRSSTPVIGPALDGGRFAAIRSTPASARWHGDSTWEHAVGPMQFIASTWEKWGADGDGDRVADPLDLDDAALATGRYLCADGHDLATAAGWTAAVHSYNHDDSYVVAVLNAANSYASRSAS